MIVQLNSLELVGELIVRGTPCCEVEGAAYLRTDHLPTRPILLLESYAEIYRITVTTILILPVVLCAVPVHGANHPNMPLATSAPPLPRVGGASSILGQGRSQTYKFTGSCKSAVQRHDAVYLIQPFF